jgi:hypothetical protein
MAEVSKSPFTRGDVHLINPAAGQNQQERKNQNTLQEIETKPDRVRAEDRVKLSDEARRQHALQSGVEDPSPNETETEAFVRQNTLIPGEQDIEEVGDPVNSVNAHGANQARNFPIDQIIAQESEVSGDILNRQRLGSGVELREDPEVNPLGNQNDPVGNRDNAGPVGERIDSQSQRADRQEGLEQSEQNLRLEREQEVSAQGAVESQIQNTGAQGAVGKLNQNITQNRTIENVENQITEPREGVSEVAARESNREQILDNANPRQSRNLESKPETAAAESGQTDQTAQTKEVTTVDQEVTEDQSADQRETRQDISQQEKRNLDPVSAQAQVGRNLDELI